MPKRGVSSLPWEIGEWAERIRAGDRRAVARAITWIENEDPRAADLMRLIHPWTGRAHFLGFTGPPGVGKSSLTDRLIGLLRRQGRKVGVVAVDPTSPFTGGALLGDRVRMGDHALDPGVFIRSMGTRGQLGGLARATKDVMKVLDAAGCDVVIAETVGVGQSELDVIHAVDTVVVVVGPAGGDHIQMLKAGIMEIGDIFVVNKADLPGAERTARQIEHMLELVHPQGWWPPVILATAAEDRGVDALWEKAREHVQYLRESGEGRRRRLQRQEDAVLDWVWARLRKEVERWKAQTKDWEEILSRVERGEKDPYEVAEEILRALGLSAGTAVDRML
ncbi:MAG: methylmalonyl Co-A mutase-associated GTPase MeaB [Alicyclobacillaceae bacterium]|nr:methylmalonyl Co-A mutase-associated GTPase MeaB [Alicyclobacillaceae bacterium]